MIAWLLCTLGVHDWWEYTRETIEGRVLERLRSCDHCHRRQRLTYRSNRHQRHKWVNR